MLVVERFQVVVVAAPGGLPAERELADVADCGDVVAEFLGGSVGEGPGGGDGPGFGQVRAAALPGEHPGRVACPGCVARFAGCDGLPGAGGWIFVDGVNVARFGIDPVMIVRRGGNRLIVARCRLGLRSVAQGIVALGGAGSCGTRSCGVMPLGLPIRQKRTKVMNAVRPVEGRIGRTDRELRPGSVGWLGTTGGITDDEVLVAVMPPDVAAPRAAQA